jgi:hypothetical protein
MRDLPKFHIETKTLKKFLKKADGNVFLHDQDQMDYDPNAPHDVSPTQPDEEDCIIQDNVRGGYGVSCGGKFIGNIKEMDAALKVVKDWQDKNQFFPTIWFVNDHGNTYPIDLQGNEIKR